MEHLNAGPPVDVSAMKAMANMECSVQFPEPEAEGGYRALDAIRRSIKELKYYAVHVQKIRV